MDVVGRGKSLNFKEVESDEPKFLTQVKDFFNTFISDDDGCNCGPECKWAKQLLDWVGVPESKMKTNYSRLLSLAYDDNGSEMPMQLSQNFGSYL